LRAIATKEPEKADERTVSDTKAAAKEMDSPNGHKQTEVESTVHSVVEAASEASRSPAEAAEGSAKAQEKDAWAAAVRFAGAMWEAFIEMCGVKGSKQPGWEYRKGIEGMSMGTMAYEIMATSEGTKEMKSLQKNYQDGWGVPFLNLSLKGVQSGFAKVRNVLGLDTVWLTMVNFLETVGLDGKLVDGIPVQNKWMKIVSQRVESYSEAPSSTSNAKEIRSFMRNLVTGQMERIAGRPMPVFLEEYGQAEGLYKIVIGPRSVVVTSDPVVMKHILTGSQDNYTKGILSEVLEPIMGKGLIPADPVTWRTRRKAIVPGMHKKFLISTSEQIAGCADRLCEEIEAAIATSKSPKGVVLDMEEKFTSVSLDIIGKAVFGYDFGSVSRESPVLKAVYSVLREAERRAQAVIPYWDLPGATELFRDQKSHQENLLLLNAVLDELIRTVIEDEDDSEGPTSLLKFLVQTRNEDVTTRQLRDDLMTMLIAGHETTAALLTWILHELMKPTSKKYLDELREEVDTVLKGRVPTYEDVAQMPVLRACLLEALRLYPQPPMLIRRCENGDDEVPTGPTCKGARGKVSFLPGQDIFMSTWSMQRSTELWGEDANEFDPSRFGRTIEGRDGWRGVQPLKVPYPNEVSSDFAFLPFGGGPRKCIGDQFALLEAEITLCVLMQRFHFAPSSETVEEEGKVDMTTGATIHTVDGLMVEVTRNPDWKPANASTSSGEPRAARPDSRSELSVAQRIEPEAMTVPTASELRMLFDAQAQKKAKGPLREDPDIDKAYEMCREVTQEHSKTFYLGSQFLVEEEQRAVWAIYNWCRSTDELVDGPLAVNTTMEDLEDWEKRLHATFRLKEADSANLNEYETALMDTISRFALIERPFQDMIGGMAMDLYKDRYQDFKELEVYCYRVAGTVGVMTLPILGFDSLQNFSVKAKEKTIDAALCLGVAFQITNILRDVGEDARTRDRIYVPVEDLLQFGISEEEVLQASKDPSSNLHKQEKWINFMEFQIERCQEYYERAMEGIVGLSEFNRLGVMAALFVYQGILDKIRKNNYDNFTKRAYVPFNEKIFLMGKAWLKVQDLKKVALDNVKSGKIFAR